VLNCAPSRTRRRSGLTPARDSDNNEERQVQQNGDEDEGEQDVAGHAAPGAGGETGKTGRTADRRIGF
jgi:hypothetical protein